MSHLHNISPRHLARGPVILFVVLMAVYLVTSNLGLVVAGGIALVAAHLILASGALLWAINRLVKFVERLHEPQS